MRLWLRISSDTREETGIELGTPGNKASGLSSTPQQLLYGMHHDEFPDPEVQEIAMISKKCLSNADANAAAI